MNKKTIILVMMFLLAVMGAKADVIPSSYYSEPAAGTYFIYDVTDQKFVGRGDAGSANRIVFESTPVKTFTLAAGENSGYTIRYDLTSTYMMYNHAGQGNSWGSDFWMDADGTTKKADWNFTLTSDKKYKISSSYSYEGESEKTGGVAKFLQGGVWATESEESAHEYALITLDNYYSYLASISTVPSIFFKEKGTGTYYIYNVKEGKFLRTQSISENNYSLLNEPVAVTLTSVSGTYKGGGDYFLSGNENCFIKIGHWKGQWLWSNAESGNADILGWTLNDKASNTFTMSITLSESFSQNDGTLAVGTYYMKNETNLVGNVGEAGLYALISTDDYFANPTLNESDNFSPANDIFAANVTVNSAMTANVWNTLVVPFDMAIPSGWTVKEPTAFDGTTITFSAASSIVAGKPYIVKPTEAVTSFSATGVTLKKDLVNTTVGTGSTVTMRGTYEKIDAIDYASQNSYVVGIKDGVSSLYKVTSTVSLKPFRAYFTVEGGAAARINIAFDDEETTGMNDVRSKMEDVRGNYYNLQGQRVENPKKGLYIVNGKKIVKR